MMKTNKKFQTIEELIATKIESILSPYDFDVVCNPTIHVYEIYKDFVYVGEFDFQKHSSIPHLAFRITYSELEYNPKKVYFGKKVTENYLNPFFSSLESFLECFSV